VATCNRLKLSGRDVLIVLTHLKVRSVAALRYRLFGGGPDKSPRHINVSMQPLLSSEASGFLKEPGRMSSTDRGGHSITGM